MNWPKHTRLYLDRENAQWRGLCAGIADYTGVDVLWVRIILIALTVAFWWPLLAYPVVAHFTPVKPGAIRGESEDKTRFWRGVRASPRQSLREVRASFRDIDRRMAEIESFITSSNARLAREIDELR